MEHTRPWEKYFNQAARAFDPEHIRFDFLADPLVAAARSMGDRPACTTLLPNGDHVTLDYSRLDALSDDLAVYLREILGVAPDDVVAIMCPNCVDYPIASFGVYKTGCIATNINPLYTEPEMAHQLRDSGAKVLMVADLFADKASRVVPDTAVEHVISLSVIDFFPPLKRALLWAVMKYVRKMLPGFRIPRVSLTRALAKGARHRRATAIDVGGYLAHRSPKDVVIYQYTGGTTGQAKGAALSHHNILVNALQMEIALGEATDPRGEVSLVALPLYHIFAFTFCLINTMIMGNHAVLVPNPRPPSNLRSAFEGFPISILAGVNTLFAALLREEWFDRHITRSLKLCIAGGTALQDSVASDWEKTLGVPIVQGYGLTEVSCAATCNLLQHNRLGTIGIPFPGLDMRVVDEAGDPVAPGTPGELVIKGPTVMTGYLGDAAETDRVIRDGWLHTGDVAIMDEDGYFRIVDRMKDLILVSGFNVYPNEVEQVIAGMKEVAEVAVIGVADDQSGEVPKAFVVAADPALTEADIRRYCAGHLAGYKRPRVIKFVDEIPKSPVGKILRKDLRAC